MDSDEFFSRSGSADLFAKIVDGECGAGIFHLKVSGGKLIFPDNASRTRFFDVLRSHRYLIQQAVSQHPAISALHPQSINTIRLITIRNRHTGKVEVFPSFLRVGTGESYVDNTSQGGLAVGIDMQTGRLHPWAFYNQIRLGTKVDTHPDSGIRFSDVTIPWFEECKAEAIRLHEMLPGLQSIGWDIAIGEEGPLFIEGNDNWEINGPQICHGGQLRQFYSLLQ